MIGDPRCSARALRARGSMDAHQQILIFANPIAGRGRGQAIARRLEKRFLAEGYGVHLLLKRPDALTPDDLPADAKAAIVIGGDGTLRSVANRLCAEFAGGDEAMAGEVVGEQEGGKPRSGAAQASATVSRSVGPPLLVVPLGTANLMGRHLGIRWADETLEDQVSAAVAGGKVVHLDAGRVNGRLFLLMVGVGFDAAVVHELDRIRRGPITMVDYVLPTAMALTGYEFPMLRVEVDGRRVFGPSPGVAFVGNVSEYGTGFPILPRARPDDGLLDICCLPCRSPFDVVRFFFLSSTGDHLTLDGVVYTRGRHVRIESPGASRPVPVQIDGDAAGHTPVAADLLPVRLPFIVP